MAEELAADLLLLLSGIMVKSGLLVMQADDLDAAGLNDADQVAVGDKLRRWRKILFSALQQKCLSPRSLACTYVIGLHVHIVSTPVYR
jgi:hypothetical protein